ncbi:hypothetical protein [Caldalkalibacillus mannanilyticus]|uniref:hypothetical protein n=1 Tax=Caldalkalibacillus mannanilyticus TaxID=1418 RepID=UPI00046904A9|nr:hypothetical protein [Caldalkalibacillus mannanilyticus]
MFKRFTFWLTLLAVVSSVVHFLGFDRDHVLFLTVSVPAWFIGLFADLRALNVGFLYVITILFWFVFGYLCDRLLQRRVRNS